VGVRSPWLAAGRRVGRIGGSARSPRRHDRGSLSPGRSPPQRRRVRRGP
jgi:hypothetical protein